MSRSQQQALCGGKAGKMKIHRANLVGNAVCGENGKISLSGAVINCEKCLEIEKPMTKEQVLEILKTKGKKL